MSYFEKINFNKRVKKDSSKLKFNTERDWLFMLGFLALTVSIILIYGIYSVSIMDKKNTYKDSDTDMVIETINREKLKNILEEYNQKNLLFEEVLLNGIKKSADPSL